jgi:DNA-binding response OmpR family regulator
MQLLLLTTDPEPSSVLPALSRLCHQLQPASLELAALFDTGPHDVVIVDARTELVFARTLCRLITGTGVEEPLVAVFTEGGLVAVSTEWGLDEFLLPSASPAELDARLRLLPPFHRGNEPAGAFRRTRPLILGELIIDQDAHTAYLGRTPLALTYREFELLAHLARYPGRVFTRSELLERVWRLDTAAGTRTIDVHIRRLRAKLGPHHHLLCTVRNTGYQLLRPPPRPNTPTTSIADHQPDGPPKSAPSGLETPKR